VEWHDIDGILAMMTDDVVFEASFGKDPWARACRPCERATVPEGHVRAHPGRPVGRDAHVVHPDVVVVEWLTTGTPKGGAPYEVEGCDILSLRDGEIAAKRSYRKGRA